MTATEVYAASPIKRGRATKAEMEHRKTALNDLVSDGQPMTVRHAYYRATVAGLVPKTEAGYGMVQRALVDMREDGDLPFAWIVDNTRWMRIPPTYSSLEEFLREGATCYRRNLWADTPVYVEIWCESDSVAGVISEITYEYAVPLMVVKGYSSVTFAHSAAKTIEADGRPAYLYYFGDRDPAGIEIEVKLRDKLSQYAPTTSIHLERMAVTAEQVARWNLPGGPVKNRKKIPFTGQSVEIEAIPAPTLRNLVRSCIEQHVDGHRLALLETYEDDERATLTRIADLIGGNK